MRVIVRGRNEFALRLGPLTKGMDWHRLEHGRWVSTDHDYGLLVVNDAHESRPSLPVNTYTESIEELARQTLQCTRYLQATVLQMWSRWDAARDLLYTNPALLWLAAEKYRLFPELRSAVVYNLHGKQSNLLGLLLGRNVRPAQTRFLRRLALDSGGQQTLHDIREVVSDEEQFFSLRHWPKVPASMLKVFIAAPHVSGLPFLRNELFSCEDFWALYRLTRQVRPLLLETVRLDNAFNAGPVTGREIMRCRSWDDVRKLLRKLRRLAEELGWFEGLDDSIDPRCRFPEPPIPSCSRFQAIGSVLELILEGREMHHCVVSRARQAMDGHVAIYRVDLNGERGTLELAVGPENSRLDISDFKLACNAEPSAHAWRAVMHWLDSHQLQFR